MWFGWPLPVWESIFFWTTAAAALFGGLSITAAFFSAIIGYEISDVVTREADTKIAESNARQKEAELKLAQLDRKITPRSISDIEAGKIVEEIKLFPSTPFAIETDPAAEYGFVNRVIELLREGGWKWNSYSASLTSLPFGDAKISDGSGVQLCINGSRFNDFNKPAMTLASALTNGLGSSVSMAIDPPNSPLACTPDAIHIRIHRKL
jgi:hypothetical protein